MPANLVRDTVVCTGVNFGVIPGIPVKLRCKGFRFIADGAVAFLLVETANGNRAIAEGTYSGVAVDDFTGTFYITPTTGIIQTGGTLVVYIGVEDEEDGE